MAGSAEPEFLLIGRVRRPHGVRGEVVVEVWSEVADRFAVDAELVVSYGGRRQSRRVAEVRPHRGSLLLRFEGCEDRDEAALLRGAVLEVAASEAPECEPGSYYYHELVGCGCRDAAAGDLGKVVRVIEDGGGLLLEISDGARSLLVPFVDRYIRRIEPRLHIDFDLPEGLIETCASSS